MEYASCINCRIHCIICEINIITFCWSFCRSISDVCVSLISVSSTSLRAVTSSCKYKSMDSSISSNSTSSKPEHSMSETKCDEEPVGKRLKLDQKHYGNFCQEGMAILEPGQTIMVIGVTCIPEFIAQLVVKCDLMLNWKEWYPSNLNDAAEGDSRGSLAEKEGFSERRRSCGTVILHASDVVTGRLGINPLDSTISGNFHTILVECYLPSPLL